MKKRNFFLLFNFPKNVFILLSLYLGLQLINIEYWMVRQTISDYI